MINAFAEKFSVNMTHYLWYFHTCAEDSQSLNSSLYSTPDQQVNRIPVTPALLTQIANAGSWNILYPDHEISDTSNDFLTKQRIAIILTILILLVFISKI